MEDKVKKKWPWWKILLIVIFIAVVGGSIGGYLGTKAPADAARSFIEQSAQGNIQAVYDTSLYSEAKKQLTFEMFSSQDIGFSKLNPISDITLNNRSVSDDKADIAGIITGNGHKYDVGVKLIKTTAGWKVYAFQLNSLGN